MNRKGSMNDSKPNQGLGWVAVTSTSFSRSRVDQLRGVVARRERRRELLLALVGFERPGHRSLRDVCLDDATLVDAVEESTDLEILGLSGGERLDDGEKNQAPDDPGDRDVALARVHAACRRRRSVGIRLLRLVLPLPRIAAVGVALLIAHRRISVPTNGFLSFIAAARSVFVPSPPVQRVTFAAMATNIQPRSIAIVGGDLMARSRIESAAAANSLEVQRLSQGDLESLENPPNVALVVLDLDSGGASMIDAWSSLAGESGPRAVGYFSHVDANLGDHARSNGVEAMPRGRFWRSLPELFSGALET